MSGYVELAAVCAWIIGFVGMLIYLHKKKYFPQGSSKSH